MPRPKYKPRSYRVERDPGTGPGGSIAPGDLTPEQVAKKNYNLRTRYGITFEDYEERWRKQKGLCATCRRPARLGTALLVDHDHQCCKPDRKMTKGGYKSTDARSCGRCVRGLLCSACNTVIGKLERRGASRAVLVEYLGR